MGLPGTDWACIVLPLYGAAGVAHNPKVAGSVLPPQPKALDRLMALIESVLKEEGGKKFYEMS